MRVIIADDMPRSRAGLRVLLDTWPGLTVVGEAANGAEAVSLVEECGPDLVLMDARMPVMDGLEAARIIKSRWPETGIVMLTMYADFRSAALDAGVDAYLDKGSGASALLDTISTTADKLRSRRVPVVKKEPRLDIR